MEKPSETTCSRIWGALRTFVSIFLPLDDPDEYENACSCRPPPLFLPLISCAELGVFIYYASTEGPVTLRGPVPTASPLIYDPHRRREAWRFISYMFIHAGWVHITTNLFFQLLIGIPLEMVHKLWRVGPIYLCGVLAGSLATSMFDNQVFLAGASAGIYALVTAHIADVIMNWSEMNSVNGLGRIVRIVVVGIFAVLDITAAVYNRHFAPIVPGQPQTGYTAHIAGTIAGLFMGVAILRNLEQKSWEAIVWWISLVLFIALCLVAILWNILYPKYPSQEI